MRTPYAVFAAVLAGIVAPRNALAGVMEQALEGTCTYDPRATSAARLAIEQAPVLDAERLREAAEEAGLSAPSVRAWVARGEEQAASRLLSGWLERQAFDARWARCAVAHDGDRWAVAVLPRHVELAGLTSRAAPRGSLRVRADLPAGASEARLLLRSPEGEVREIERSPDGTYRWEFGSAGNYTVQLVAQTEAGPMPFAQRAVLVGNPAPATRAETDEEPPTIDDERQVLAAVNRERERMGLSPLRVDPLLSRIANDRARALAARGRVEHAGAGGGPEERLRDAGVGVRRLAENVARARSVGDAHRRLSSSPSHRANRLDPSMDAAGLGLATVGEQIYLVELYASQPHL